MWKYLHHGSWQTLQIRVYLPPPRPGESVYQHASAFGVFGAELIDSQQKLGPVTVRL